MDSEKDFERLKRVCEAIVVAFRTQFQNFADRRQEALMVDAIFDDNNRKLIVGFTGFTLTVSQTNLLVANLGYYPFNPLPPAHNLIADAIQRTNMVEFELNSEATEEAEQACRFISGQIANTYKPRSTIESSESLN